MKIKLVKQKDKCGCGVACLAMLTNKTYDAVRSEFRCDFETDGMTTKTFVDYLGDAGFSVLHKQISHYADKDMMRDEMAKPFAHAHAAVIKWKADTGEHFVVMDAKGKFYCPSGLETSEVESAYIISEVIGIYK